MINKEASPYICHIFVCTNDRKGMRKSCADGNSPQLKAALKEGISKINGVKGKVRVSSSGCMGLCQHGPNVMIYPHGIWFSPASMDDLEEIISVVKAIVETEGADNG